MMKKPTTAMTAIVAVLRPGPPVEDPVDVVPAELPPVFPDDNADVGLDVPKVVAAIPLTEVAAAVEEAAGAPASVVTAKARTVVSLCPHA